MNFVKTWNRISNVMKSKTASSEIESNGMLLCYVKCMDGG